MADAELVQRAKHLLDLLSETPRFAGSAEESRARELCRQELEKAGFACREAPFEFSEWPARWAPPLATAVHLALLILVAQLGKRDRPVLALITFLAAAVVLAAVGARVRRHGVLSFSRGRARSVNLEAVRGRPSVWLVAHLDSKSQTVPMLVRIESSVALQLISFSVAIALVVSIAGVHVAGSFWLAIEGAAVVAAAPTLLCFIGNASPGAVDNATGVVAAILAATIDGAPRELGVLVTSGEELGLAGARAWAASAPANLRILNCDTIDDVGGWRCMYSGAEPVTITGLARQSGAATGLTVKTGKLLVGILADNIAFADRGIEAVTLSRGNFSTLARIHTWRDNSIALTGQGAAEAGVLLSALAKELG